MTTERQGATACILMGSPGALRSRGPSRVRRGCGTGRTDAEGRTDGLHDRSRTDAGLRRSGGCSSSARVARLWRMPPSSRRRRSNPPGDIDQSSRIAGVVFLRVRDALGRLWAECISQPPVVGVLLSGPLHVVPDGERMTAAFHLPRGNPHHCGHVVSFARADHMTRAASAGADDPDAGGIPALMACEDGRDAHRPAPSPPCVRRRR